MDILYTHTYTHKLSIPLEFYHIPHLNTKSPKSVLMQTSHHALIILGVVAVGGGVLRFD